MFLLLPEWQGCGVSSAPATGARLLSDVLFAGRDVVRIDAPAEEALVTDAGVLGLSSIATRLSQTLAAIRQADPERIVTIGATCGVEVAPIAWLNERYAGDLAVLWLDAHADLNTPDSSPSGHFHGMVLRTLLAHGPAALVDQIPRPLSARQVWLVGARDLDPPEAQFVAASGLAVVGDDAFAQPQDFIDRLKQAGFQRIYVHFDVDVLNPQDFPSALMAAPGGPTLDRVTRLLQRLHEACDVVGFSVVEYCERGATTDRSRLTDALGPFMPAAS